MTVDTRMFYVSNCIKRIMAAPCSNRCVNQRADEIALAVEIAASESLEAAHQYLIQLSKDAEAGKYTN